MVAEGFLHSPGTKTYRRRKSPDDPTRGDESALRFRPFIVDGADLSCLAAALLLMGDAVPGFLALRWCQRLYAAMS